MMTQSFRHGRTPHRARGLARAALIALVLIAVAACGRKGSPIPPPDADAAAPRVYPVDRSQPQRQDVEPTTPTQEQSAPRLQDPPAIFYSR